MIPLPSGFGVVLDGSVRSFAGGSVLVGGHPGRLLRLTGRGVETLDRLLGDGDDSPAGRLLARRLVDAGMAHPCPPPGPPGGAPDVTVVVPVRDRSAELDRCLGALGGGVPVVVVDDGSADPDAVRAVCRRHGARLLARVASGGPGAARNEALPEVATTLVAFLDSDCVAPAGWLDGLLPHFADPAVGAVAPRIRPVPRPGRPTARERFAASHSPLDMGDAPGGVGPGRAVRYVPTAALVVRRRALEGLGFDPGLRYGEDVDLVWRLVGAGWHVRYDPSTVVGHADPATWTGLLARRYRYGTSAGPLARRHPGRLPPLELRPWPAGAALALLAGRPRVAAALTAASALLLARRLRGSGVPPAMAVRWSAQGTGGTLVGLGHAATMLAWPALLVSLAGGRGRRPAALLALLPPLAAWWRGRPALDPLRWTAASVADDVAYGTGVWVGAARARTASPLVPAVRTGLAG